MSTTVLEDLPPDILEIIGCLLDYRSAVALLTLNKNLRFKLLCCGQFWKHLCKLQELDEYFSILTDESAESGSRLCYNARSLHTYDVTNDSPLWRRIYLRGMEMRRNVCAGKFQLWRLYATDEEHCPVIEYSFNTSDRELRLKHRKSSKYDQRRRTRGDRFWTSEYFLSIQGVGTARFFDIFVWSWHNGRNPQFMFSVDLFKIYPGGLTQFSVWKHYFVTLLTPAQVDDSGVLLRVYDIKERFSLLSEYSLPLGVQRWDSEIPLCIVEDKVVVLTSTQLTEESRLTLFIFSLPHLVLMYKGYLPDLDFVLTEHSLEAQVLIKNSVVQYYLGVTGFLGEYQTEGSLLHVDLSNFTSTGEPVFRICNGFEKSSGFNESMQLVEENLLLCSNYQGWIILKELLLKENKIETIDKLVIQTIPSLEVNSSLHSDFLKVLFNSTCQLYLAFRHFKPPHGRQIHAYNPDGKLVYTIKVDDPVYDLATTKGFVQIEEYKNFIVLSDLHKILIFKMKTGELVTTVQIPKHYGYREDVRETQDEMCWKGHTDLSFTEDAIILVHSHWNFPVAADVLLFW